MHITEFRIKDHGIRDCKVVDVWIDGKFYATIYPFQDNPGIRIVSKHFEAVRMPNSICFEIKFEEIGETLNESDSRKESGSTGNTSESC